MAAVQLSAAPTAGAAQTAKKPGTYTGLAIPFSGPASYEGLAPTLPTDPSQLNQPLGQQRADQIAQKLNLRKQDTLTQEQDELFITGGGNNDDQHARYLVNASVAILTNTTGRPLYSMVNAVQTPSVLGSYGLFDPPGRRCRDLSSCGNGQVPYADYMSSLPQG